MKWKSLFIISLCILSVILTVTFAGCGGGEKGSNGVPDVPGTSTITIHWSANHETLVNAPGGGYRVYYSKYSGFELNDPGVSMKEVPFISGTQSPTSTSLTLENGTWYIKVCACMDLNGMIISAPSNEESITLP